jgi:hypothetical protein
VSHPFSTASASGRKKQANPRGCEDDPRFGGGKQVAAVQLGAAAALANESFGMTVTDRASAPADRPADRLDAAAVLAVTACCASWGVNQVAIKIANAGISPVLQVGLRSAFALVLVFAWARARGVRLFERDRTLWSGIVAGLLFGLEFVLMYVGLMHTTASRGVVLLYLAPFVVAFGAHYLIPGDRLSVS